MPLKPLGGASEVELAAQAEQSAAQGQSEAVLAGAMGHPELRSIPDDVLLGILAARHAERASHPPAGLPSFAQVGVEPSAAQATAGGGSAAPILAVAVHNKLPVQTDALAAGTVA